MYLLAYTFGINNKFHRNNVHTYIILCEQKELCLACAQYFDHIVSWIVTNGFGWCWLSLFRVYLTYRLVFFSLQYPSLVLILISFSGHSTQLTRICCLCHAATAALDNKAFPTVPLKCGITYHFRSDSPLHSISIGTTWKLTTLPITDLRTTASSASDSTLHSTNCYEWKRLLPCETLTSVSTGGISTELQDSAVD